MERKPRGDVESGLGADASVQGGIGDRVEQSPVQSENA
jgi:hypothetical protein